MNLNNVQIAGRLGQDPEMGYTTSRTAVCKIRVAVDKTYSKADGSREEKTDWINATAFGKTAENINKYFQRGKPIYFEGHLRESSWDDKATGKRRTKLEVVIVRFEFFPVNVPDGQSRARQNQTEAQYGSAGDPSDGEFYGNSQDPF